MKTCLYKMDVPSKQPPNTRMRVTVTDVRGGISLLFCLLITTRYPVDMHIRFIGTGNMKLYTVSVHKNIFKEKLNYISIECTVLLKGEVATHTKAAET